MTLLQKFFHFLLKEADVVTEIVWRFCHNCHIHYPEHNVKNHHCS